ncbi:MAG: hypothetical protein AAF360_07805, partial [Pseudomonadota bacterium]
RLHDLRILRLLEMRLTQRPADWRDMSGARGPVLTSPGGGPFSVLTAVSGAESGAGVRERRPEAQVAAPSR